MPLVNGMTENDQQHPHVKPGDAPPSYTSPNPNFSTSTHTFYNPHTHPPVPHDPHYMTYAYNANAHNSPYDLPHPHQPPQELALTSPTTAPSTPHQFRSHKSMYGHVRGPSELSGEHALKLGFASYDKYASSTTGDSDTKAHTEEEEDGGDTW
ncbi:hypothetical protein PtrSN002B_000095 [Pyrenophora tritici-repentis]|nr:hypothetical protein PtrSN001C_000912 [Pyrenophora tritici-repentis]KAI1558915.1 hypothetical protein PtrSN002B_000095 [Pyrenophora tritici-repentis]